MALRTELPSGGLAGSDIPRTDLMLLWRHVARGALEKRVRRHGFGSLNPGVACRAFPGNRRWLRIVRPVAGDTRLHRIVRHRVDLRKPSRA